MCSAGAVFMCLRITASAAVSEWIFCCDNRLIRPASVKICPLRNSPTDCLPPVEFGGVGNYLYHSLICNVRSIRSMIALNCSLFSFG